jgi:hypothetical protein
VEDNPKIDLSEMICVMWIELTDSGVQWHILVQCNLGLNTIVDVSLGP